MPDLSSRRASAAPAAHGRPQRLGMSGSRMVVVMATAIVVAACASGGGASTASSASTESRPPAPRRSQNVITPEELANYHTGNLYDAINKLRPQMLRQRSAGGAVPGSVAALGTDRPNVYLDDQLFGEVERLRELTTSGVVRVQYYSPTEAQSRFGNGNLGGVIQVVMRR